MNYEDTMRELMTQGIDALLPCPFCAREFQGQWGEGPYIAVSAGAGLRFYSVVCTGCCSTAQSSTLSGAVKIWNTRNGGYECDGRNCPERAHDHKPRI